jgi:hypothetical protein
MHGSHKLWITIAVFLVVIGLLLGMYFTATPDKVGSVIKNKQTEKMKNLANKKNETSRVIYDTPHEIVQQEDNVPEELKSLDLDSIKAEHGGSMPETAEED